MDPRYNGVLDADKVEKAVSEIMDKVVKPLELNWLEVAKVCKALQVASEAMIVHNIEQLEREREQVIELLRKTV